MQTTYLDHAATTPVHPEVRAAMQPYLDTEFGNPSSLHRLGRTSRKAVEQARETIARAIGADAAELIFTSSGTEADNMAIVGVALANRERGKHLITSAVEHQAVLHSCQFLEQFGFEVTYLPVDKTGMVRVDDVAAALRPDTTLVSIMFANNEVGTIQPIAEIGSLLKERQVYFHTDAVQAFASIPFTVEELQVDLLTISAHKLNGPKGIGALYMARRVHALPHTLGGSQERKRRAGTENVAGIVGFGAAVEISQATMEQRRETYRQLRQAMRDVWQREGISYVINGNEEQCVPHIFNVSFPGTDTETMLMNLDLAGIAAASGSACTSGSLEISHVLQAMGLADSITRSAIRFSFGSTNTLEEVIRAAEEVARIVHRLQSQKQQ